MLKPWEGVNIDFQYCANKEGVEEKERQDGVIGVRGEAPFLVHRASSPAQGQPGHMDLFVTLCEFRRTTHAGGHPPPSGKTLCI